MSGADDQQQMQRALDAAIHYINALRLEVVDNAILDEREEDFETALSAIPVHADSIEGGQL